MINHNELLSEIRKRVEEDPKGKALATLIIEKKKLGLTKNEAEQLLNIVFLEYQNITPHTQLAEEKADAIADVLDRVTGWCSHGHIYPDAQ